MMMGFLPQRWPIWLKPELVRIDGPPVGPFPTSHPVSRTAACSSSPGYQGIFRSIPVCRLGSSTAVYTALASDRFKDFWRE
jgi:hypothetical protein